MLGIDPQARIIRRHLGRFQPRAARNIAIIRDRHFGQGGEVCELLDIFAWAPPFDGLDIEADRFLVFII
jgi:hypothetical protein